MYNSVLCIGSAVSLNLTNKLLIISDEIRLKFRDKVKCVMFLYFDVRHLFTTSKPF